MAAADNDDDESIWEHRPWFIFPAARRVFDIEGITSPHKKFALVVSILLHGLIWEVANVSSS